jgi:hypothetical protein
MQGTILWKPCGPYSGRVRIFSTYRGVTNIRLFTHLPLIAPEKCVLRIGGEAYVWDEVRCVTFDGTFEHEACNRSTETRVILIASARYIWRGE